MDYQELTQLAAKEDNQGIERLLKIAEELSEEDQKEKMDLIKDWIKQNPFGLRSLPRKIEGMNNKFIFITVDFEIRRESHKGQKFWPLIQLLETALDKRNRIDIQLLSKTMSKDIYSYAGANRESEIVFLMEDYFGLRKSMWSSDLEDAEVRIWADLLADEIEKRFHASKSEH